MKVPMTLAVVGPILVSAYGGGPRGRGYGPGFGRGGFGCSSDDDCGFFGGGCASSCFSSFWATATPTPTAFCDDNSALKTCISSACDDDDDKFSSFSSRRSSLCSEFSSCSSTGTYTYSLKTPDGPWRDHITRTWSTDEVVYTGCPWNGDGWGFPFWGGLGYGDDFWDNMGPGWKHTTVTTTVTSASESAVVTLEQAVSGDTTTFRTLGQAAEETAGTTSPNAAPTGSLNGVKVVGAALGAVVVAAGML